MGDMEGQHQNAELYMRLPTQLLMSNSAVPAMSSNVPPHMRQATERNVPPAMSSNVPPHMRRVLLSNVPPLMRSSALEAVEDMEDMASLSAPLCPNSPV